MAGATNMISNWAGGGATVTLGALQTLYGLQQQKKNKRPTYEIPSEIADNMSQANQAALQGLPEEQRQQFISNLQRSTSYGMSQLGTRKSGLAGVSALNQNENRGYANLLSMDAQARMHNQQQLYGMRQNMADYKDQAFQINKSNPYYEKTAQNNALIGAGMQNMSQGFQAGNTGGGGGYGQNQPQQRQMSVPTEQQNFGTYGQGQNYYNYNASSNQGGIVPDGNQYGDTSSYV